MAATGMPCSSLHLTSPVALVALAELHLDLERQQQHGAQ